MTDMLDGFPKLVKGGIAGTLCLAFLWIVYVMSTANATAAQVEELQNTTREQMRVVIRLLEDQLRVARLNCRLVAETPAERVACDQ